jgi:hypothetical protein
MLALRVDLCQEGQMTGRVAACSDQAIKNIKEGMSS